MTKLFFLTVFAFLAQIFWAIKLNYPPSFEQLLIPLTGVWQLWLVRAATLVFLFYIFKAVSLLIRQEARPYYWLLLSLSPLPILLVLSYPLSALKLGVSLMIILKAPKHLAGKAVSLGLIFLLLYLTNIKFLHERPSIIARFSFVSLQAKVQNRFDKEHLLAPGNPVPFLIKRLAYNKYFFLIKGVGEEALHFADLESLFFQENPPQNYKSAPIFFYSELGIFFLALWLWVNGKVVKTGKDDIFLFASLFYFLLTDDQAFLRYPLAFVFLALFMAAALPVLFRFSPVIKFITISFFILSLYGGLANYADRLKRPDFWLDNRPLVYQRLFTTVPFTSYSSVYIADLFGQGSRYCRFYNSDCTKFKIENFQMNDLVPRDKVLYAGFVGNFFGINIYENYGRFTPEDYIGQPKIEVIKSIPVYDNTANGYGQKLIFAIKNKLYEIK